jgi:hypothetical protein
MTAGITGTIWTVRDLSGCLRMRITWTMVLFASYAGYCFWTGIRPNGPMKWYDRTIRITGGIFLSGLLVPIVLARRN